MTFSDMRDEPKGDQIRISLDFESKADWDAASDDDKLSAVQDFFYENGFPEWSWDDAESAKRR